MDHDGDSDPDPDTDSRMKAIIDRRWNEEQPTDPGEEKP